MSEFQGGLSDCRFDFRRQGMVPLAFCISVALSACQSHPASRSDTGGAWFEADVTKLEEGGEEVAILLQRADASSEEVFEIRLSGEAKPGIDFQLADFFLEEGPRQITMEAGQLEYELEISVLDDIHAEADEQIIIGAEPVDSNGDTARIQLLISFNDFVVTRTDDSGEGTLRQAMLNANATKGSNTIRKF